MLSLPAEKTALLLRTMRICVRDFDKCQTLARDQRISWSAPVVMPGIRKNPCRAAHPVVVIVGFTMSAAKPADMDGWYGTGQGKSNYETSALVEGHRCRSGTEGCPLGMPLSGVFQPVPSSGLRYGGS